MEPCPSPAPEGGPDASPEQNGSRGLLPFPLKHIGRAGQVVIVTSRSWVSTQAVLQAFEEGPHGWIRTFGPLPARVGRMGMIPAHRRMQGSGTTPAGTFPLTMAFGLEEDPGTRLPYVHVTSPDHWWVADPVSPHYNTLRLAEDGGFRASESGQSGSERISAHPFEYRMALVVDFNRPQPMRKRGAGIFVRGDTGQSTEGSVGLDNEALTGLLRWLDPTQRPVITIAPERAITQY